MDELATVEQQETALGLSDNEQKVAFWLATNSVPGVGNVITLTSLAKQLGVHRNTVYAMANRPAIRAAAKAMLDDFIQYECIPPILQNIWVEAMQDAKFGLQVIKWLTDQGLDPLLAPPKDTAPQHLHLHVAGGFEAAVRSRGSE